MNKGELIENVSNAAGISKSEATKAVESFTESISVALNGGDKVSLVGFGTFSTKKRNARTGRNPRTGESIQIPAKTVVKFAAGKGLTESVN